MPDPRQFDGSAKYGPDTTGVFGIPDRSVIAVLIIAIFLRMSHLHELVGEWAFQLLLAVELAIYSYYLVIAVRKFGYASIVIVVAYVSFLILQTFNFSAKAGTPVNVNSIFEYITILSILAFYQTKAPLEFIQKVIIYFAFCYLVIYNVFYDQILAAAPVDGSLFRPASAGREDRVNLSSGVASFALIVGLFSLRKAPLKGIGLALLAAVAIFSAESRASSVAIALGIMSFLGGVTLPRLRPAINWTMALIFVSLTVYLVSPVIGLQYNPYSPLATDASGWARYLQFQDGMDRLTGNIFWGVGIHSSIDDLQRYVVPARPFFTSDLGVFGIAFTFGIFFALLYVILSIVLITKPPRNEKGAIYVPLFYCVQLQAFIGFFSAGILNSTTAVFVALTVTCWLRARSAGLPNRQSYGLTRPIASNRELRRL